jgi:aspartyl/asparaginyl-tRNA synthetase
MARKGIQKEDLITIDGFVEEVELEGAKIGIVVNDGEHDYYVVLDKKGKNLRNHVGEEVEVSGTLSEKSGDLWLKVTYFHVIDYYEEMYDDDYYDRDYDDRWSA